MCVVSSVISKSALNEHPFHTESSTAGFSPKIDILCNLNDKNDVGIEVKKSRTPDWQQCKIHYNDHKKQWVPVVKECFRKYYHFIFEELLKNCNLYNGMIPPFMERSITHTEWKEIKASTKPQKLIDSDENLSDSISKTKKSIQPMSTVFDQALHVLGDYISLKLIKKLKINKKDLWKSHANLE